MIASDFDRFNQVVIRGGVGWGGGMVNPFKLVSLKWSDGLL